MSKYTTEIYEIIHQNKRKKESENLLVSEWFATYLSELCDNLKASTIGSYRQTVSNHINRILGEIQLKDISSEVLQFFIKVLKNGDEHTDPLSAKSIKNIYGVLHKGLSMAHKLGYMAADITEMMVVLPRTRQAEITPLTNDEISALLAHIKGSQYQLIITTAIFTGMRESELLGLQWSDIDFSSGKINVTRQLMRNKLTNQFCLTSLKSNRPRSIKPAVFLIEELKRAYNGVRQGFVFVNEKTGRHMYHNAVYRYLKTASEKAFGRANVRFHDLRHTYAVLSLQAGDDYKTLQENMGHYSAAFTLDRYGHCTDDMKTASSQRMESYFNQTFSKPAEDDNGIAHV